MPVHYRSAALKKNANPKSEMRDFIDMKRAFVLLLLCLVSSPMQFAAARDQGVINDPDGFTNVRAEPRETAAIIARVKTGEVFELGGVAANGSEWEKVTLSSGKTGWMHYSRIRLFAALSDIVDGGEHDEVNEYARREGLDYYPLARAAAKGEQTAMRTYFKFRGDGAAGETHVEVLITVIHLLGDNKLAKVVSQQSVEDREALRSNIELGLENSLPFEAKGYLKRNFPKTARAFSRP
jgi:hypothetical protein